MLNNATDVHQAVAIQEELQVAKMPLPTQATIDVTTWPGRCHDFVVIFFFAINLKCFKNKIGTFKEITVSKLTCLNICDISICHTSLSFCNPFLLPFSIFSSSPRDDRSLEFTARRHQNGSPRNRGICFG